MKILTANGVFRRASPLGLALILVILAMSISACANRHAKTGESVPDYYIVQAADNLDSIAFLLETTPAQLLHLNSKIKRDDIKPGMRLIVPSGLAGNSITKIELNKSMSGFIWPVANLDISSRFGNRRGRFHNGIDLRAPKGTAIYACAQGRVIYSGFENGYGNIIIIQHAEGIESAYGHNYRNLVKTGQLVKKGQTIATVGKTGNATGNHVHFEIRLQGKVVDPSRYIRTGL